MVAWFRCFSNKIVSSGALAMEFPGIGVIPYEAPSEELRPFFVRKYNVWFK